MRQLHHRRNASSVYQRHVSAQSRNEDLTEDMAVRVDITVVQRSPPSASEEFTPQPQTIERQRIRTEAVLCGESCTSSDRKASASSMIFELYEYPHRPSSSFVPLDSHQVCKIDVAPNSPTYSDTSSFKTNAPAYPLTRITTGSATTMDATASLGQAVSLQLAQPTSSTTTLASQSSAHSQKRKKDWRFWIIFTSLMVVCTLTALDMTMISTALPGIVRALPVSNVSPTWVTSAYLLTMTASQPAFGGLSCVAGRRWSLIISVVLFLGGSVACALAPTMLALCIGRGIQGLGGGGIQALCEIIVSDITTLKERGFFIGLVGLVFAIASFVAPVLGGAFSTHNWPWIFWLNLPIGFVALVLVVPFMNLTSPAMSLRSKIERMDLVGNLVLFCSVVGILIGTTDGGITHPWSDPKVYLPLVFGLIGFCIFLGIEFIPNPLCRTPILPLKLFSNKTAASAFFQTFVHGIVTYGCIYIIPIYFQAIKDESPLRSAISQFPATAPTAPVAMAAGIVMALTGRYKITLFLGWALLCVGSGWLTRFQVSTARWELYTAEVVMGMGVGTLFAITLPPIQASLPPSELELATATYAFCRSFGSIWGIAVATTIFTTSVARELNTIPDAAMFGLTGQTSLGFVEEIQHLPDTIREPVRAIFADAIQNSMWLYLPLSIVGLISVYFIDELPLPDFIRSETRMDSPKAGSKEAESRSSPLSDAEEGSHDVSWTTKSQEKDAMSSYSAGPSSPQYYGASTFLKNQGHSAGRSSDNLESGGPTLAPSEIDPDERREDEKRGLGIRV